ncbi:MAG: UbiX family flavin prenyltransferase [Rhodospirillaceae bacterium]
MLGDSLAPFDLTANRIRQPPDTFMDKRRQTPHITGMSNQETEKKRVLIAVTGASGADYGQRLLEMLRDAPDVESHLVISKSGRLTISAELGRDAAEVEALADVVHLSGNVGAAPASGSFRLDAMIVAPCSVKTASNIAYGNTSDLITRAADVQLKERRTLVLAVRETPLHAGHLETLTKLAHLGAVIFPPVPAFYQKPEAVRDIVDQTCMRLLDQAGVRVEAAPRWGEAGGIKAIGGEG